MSESDGSYGPEQLDRLVTGQHRGATERAAEQPRGASPGERLLPTDDLDGRARATEQKNARIDHIVDLMCDGRWNTKSYRALATEWGCSVDAVRDYANSASAVVRRVVHGSEEELRTRLVAWMESIGERARTRTRTVVTKDGQVFEVPDADLHTELEAADKIGKTLGLHVTKVQAVPGDGLPDDPAALAELARQEIAKIEGGS
jgi:hypothetical protein